MPPSVSPERHLLRAIDPVHTFAPDCGIALDPWQGRTLGSQSNRIALRVCRQAGKSTVAALRGLHQARYVPDSLVLIFAPGDRQSKLLFDKVTGFRRVLEPDDKSAEETTHSIRFANGSRIVALPGNPQTIRGFSAPALIIVDEAAHLDADDELVAAILPMLARSNGRLIVMSTPNGRRGWFHRVCNDPAYEQIVVTWKDTSHINADQLEEFRRELGPTLFRQELEVEFLDSSVMPFPSALVDEALAPDLVPLFDRSQDDLDRQAEADKEAGTLREYFVAVDLGQSIDATAIVILERTVTIDGVTRLDLVHLEILEQGMRYPDQVDHIHALVMRRPLARNHQLVIDRSGVGRGIFDLMTDAKMYPVGVSIRGGEGDSGEGWERTVSKHKLVTRLQTLMHEHKLSISAGLEHVPALINEFRNFVMRRTEGGNWQFGAASGSHDDLISALTLAVWRAHDYHASTGLLEFYRREAIKRGMQPETAEAPATHWDRSPGLRIGR